MLKKIFSYLTLIKKVIQCQFKDFWVKTSQYLKQNFFIQKLYFLQLIRYCSGFQGIIDIFQGQATYYFYWEFIKNLFNTNVFRLIIICNINLYKKLIKGKILIIRIYKINEYKAFIQQKVPMHNDSQNKHIKPIRLIAIDEKTKKLSVSQQAIEWLCQKVNQQKHIGVVTVVGKYRTGKSYILNRVLLNQNNGFQVGPTINACTKGLWVWPQLIQSQQDPTKQYMVMDTQGLGSLQEGEQNDTKIFLMAMLLSSYFIYNSIGSIDQKAVQNLSLIINLSKMLQNGSERQKQDILNCFPTFLWLVRDFALRLEDQKGRKITPQQYLQNALKLQKGASDLVNRKNSIRKQLISFFRDRDCFMLIRPVDDQKKLQDMSRLKDSQMRPRFLELVNQLRSKVLVDIKKKTFKGKPCSPAMFIQLCQYFCDSINKGGLPQIESNWELVCKAESTRIQKKIYKQFYADMDALQKADINCLNIKQIQQKLTKKISQWLKHYQKNALVSKGDKKKQMKQKMEQQFQQVKKRLSDVKNTKLDEDITQLSNLIESDINSNKINTIFQIAQKFDETIEAQSKKANHQTLSYLYRRCYEGLKSSSFTYFGNSLQSQKYQTNLLTQKIGFYQNSFNRIQGQSTKRNQQFDRKQRQMRQNVFQLQIKVREASQQLRKAKSQLNSIYVSKDQSLGNKQNYNVNLSN